MGARVQGRRVLAKRQGRGSSEAGHKRHDVSRHRRRDQQCVLALELEDAQLAVRLHVLDLVPASKQSPVEVVDSRDVAHAHYRAGALNGCTTRPARSH
eukprot:1936694-Prymnesium_polylepis.1